MVEVFNYAGRSLGFYTSFDACNINGKEAFKVVEDALNKEFEVFPTIEHMLKAKADYWEKVALHFLTYLSEIGYICKDPDENLRWMHSRELVSSVVFDN